jgi:hypothetical protein
MPRNVLALCLALAVAGCAGGPTKQEKTAAAYKAAGLKVNQDQLRLRVVEVAQAYLKATQKLAVHVLDNSEDRTLRRRALVLRLETIGTLRRIYRVQDPRAGFLDVWTLCYQSLYSVQAEHVKDLLGDMHEFAVQIFRELADSVTSTAEEVLPAETYEATLQSVQEFAHANTVDPFKLRRVKRPSLEAKKGGTSFTEILLLPTKPFAIGEGVSESAAAIDRIGKAADRAVDVLELAPMEVRFQTELLLFDLRQESVIRDTLTNVDQLNASIERISKTAADLPGRIDAQIEKAYREIETQNAELRATVTEVKDTMTEAKATVTEVQSALKEADTVVASVERASGEFAKAGTAWEPTVREVKELLEFIEGPEPAEPEPEDPGPSDITEMARTAENLTKAAAELRLLIADARDLLGSDDVTDRIENVDTTARGTVDYATVKAADLTDHIIFRVFLLLVGFFLALFGYRFAVTRLLRKGG